MTHSPPKEGDVDFLLQRCKNLITQDRAKNIRIPFGYRRENGRYPKAYLDIELEDYTELTGPCVKISLKDYESHEVKEIFMTDSPFALKFLREAIKTGEAWLLYRYLGDCESEIG